MIGHIIHHIDKYGYSAGAACTETFQRTDHAIARRQKKDIEVLMRQLVFSVIKYFLQMLTYVDYIFLNR